MVYLRSSQQVLKWITGRTYFYFISLSLLINYLSILEWNIIWKPIEMGLLKWGSSFPQVHSTLTMFRGYHITLRISIKDPHQTVDFTTLSSGTYKIVGFCNLDRQLKIVTWLSVCGTIYFSLFWIERWLDMHFKNFMKPCINIRHINWLEPFTIHMCHIWFWTEVITANHTIQETRKPWKTRTALVDCWCINGLYMHV